MLIYESTIRNVLWYNLYFHCLRKYDAIGIFERDSLCYCLSVILRHVDEQEDEG